MNVMRLTSSFYNKLFSKVVRTVKVIPLKLRALFLQAYVTCKRSGVSVTDFNVMLAAEYLDVCLILGSE